MKIDLSSLGKETNYTIEYSPKLLFTIPRIEQRKELGVESNNLPFYGIDIWNSYELSWLNLKGKPQVAIGEFYIPAHTNCLIESKSLKLYLNSLNNLKFASIKQVQDLINNDLIVALQDNTVTVKLFDLNVQRHIAEFKGVNIDSLDIECNIYNMPSADIIQYNEEYVEEEVHSNLLKSNCLVTNQPDWGSIFIQYKGQKICHESLLKYLVSFRNHNEFHEHCIERIFIDIYNKISPQYLSIYGRYTRRGGLDICPFRSTDKNFVIPSNERLIRQ
jgi:7-cyano-7-deazaguanine reductase